MTGPLIIEKGLAIQNNPLGAMDMTESVLLLVASYVSSYSTPRHSLDSPLI